MMIMTVMLKHAMMVLVMTYLFDSSSCGEYMREDEVSKALTTYFDGLGLPHPVVWPNSHVENSSLPDSFIAFQQVRTGANVRDLKGGKKNSAGYVELSFATPLGEFATVSEVVATNVVEMITLGHRILTSSGVVTLTNVVIGTAFNDGRRWRTPVRVDYSARTS